MDGAEAAQLAVKRKKKSEKKSEGTEQASVSHDDDSSFHTVSPNQLMTLAGIFVFLVLLAHTLQKLMG